MELVTNISLEDFRGLQKNMMKRLANSNSVKSKNIINGRLPFFLFIVLVTVALQATNIVDFSLEQLGQNLGFLLFFGLIFLFLFFLRLSQHSPNENGLLLGRHKLRFSPEGLEQEGDLFIAKYRWNLLEEITETPTHFFLYLDRIAGIVIPKNCFPSSGDSSTFIEMVREYAPQVKFG